MVAAKWARLKKGDVASQMSGPPIGGPQPTETTTRNKAAELLKVGTTRQLTGLSERRASRNTPATIRLDLL
jgi:hypothetical protein